MEEVEFIDGDPTFDEDTPTAREYYLAACPNCCHWTFEANEGTKHCMDAPVVVDAKSVARKFESPLPNGCATEVAQYLRRNPAFWNTMAPRDMERFVADIFRANFRHSEVTHVGKTGDLGIDILYVDANQEDWLEPISQPLLP